MINLVNNIDQSTVLQELGNTQNAAAIATAFLVLGVAYVVLNQCSTGDDPRAMDRLPEPLPQRDVMGRLPLTDELANKIARQERLDEQLETGRQNKQVAPDPSVSLVEQMRQARMRGVSSSSPIMSCRAFVLPVNMFRGEGSFPGQRPLKDPRVLRLQRAE